MLRCVVSSIPVSVWRRIIDGRGHDTHEYTAAPAAAPRPTVPAPTTAAVPTTMPAVPATMPAVAAAVPVG